MMREAGRNRRNSRLVWICWALCMALGAGAFVLRIWNIPALTEIGLSGRELFYEILLWSILVPASIPAYATAGAIIAAQHPGNRIGWLSMSLAALVALADFSWQYAMRSNNITRDPLPGHVLADWFAGLFGTLLTAPVPLTLMLLIFPNGKLPSRRWRIVVLTAILGALVLTIAPLLNWKIYDNFANENPFLVTPSPLKSLEWLAEIFEVGGLLVSLITLILAMFSMGVRWRNSSGVERLQIKWVAVVSIVSALATVVGIMLTLVPGAVPVQEALLAFALAQATIGIPVAVGIAILRYQLFQIDRIIQRTVVYGVLTFTLLAVYIGTAVTMQTVFQLLTGQRSDLAVIISTLVIAALFGPLHDRVQRTVDRYFYRSKYDAERTIEAFSLRLRDEVDLERLAARLLFVTDQLVQPSDISLWLVNPQVSTAREEQQD